MDSELDTGKSRIEERLGQIECKLDMISSSSNSVGLSAGEYRSSDEIDLRELWNVVWAGKFKIVISVVLSAVISVVYSLSLPNTYQSVTILASAQDDSKNGLGGFATQYGGLAAMAGINLGGNSSRVDQAVELIKSWPFLESFFNKYNLKPKLMAVEGWNKKSNKLIYNYDIYNPETKEWARDVDDEGGHTSEPSSFETFKVLRNMLTVSTDKNTGMLTIGIEYFSPQLAFEWVNLLKRELNNYYQNQDMAEAQKNIDYLNIKIAETNVADMQSVFYGMIESQTQTLMLAEVSEQYLVKTVVPAKVAERKLRPKRALICVLGVMLGGMLAVLFVLFRYFSQKDQNESFRVIK